MPKFLRCLGKKKRTKGEFKKEEVVVGPQANGDLKEKIIVEESIKETKPYNELQVTPSPEDKEMKEIQDIKKEFVSTSSQTIFIDSFANLPSNFEELKKSEENLMVENDESGNYVKFDKGIPKIIRSTNNDQKVFQKHFLFEWDNLKGCYILKQPPIRDDDRIGPNTRDMGARNVGLHEHQVFESFLKELTDVTLSNMRKKCEEMLSDRRINAEIQSSVRNVLISHISRDQNVDQETICDSLKKLQLDEAMYKEIKNVATDLIIARLAQDDIYFLNKNNLYKSPIDQNKQHLTKSALKKPNKVKSSTCEKKAQKFAVEIPENVDTSKDIILDIFFKKKSGKKKKVRF